MLQPKDMGWLNGYKNKTCLCGVYKGHASDLGTNTKWGDGKRGSTQMEIERKLEQWYSYQTKQTTRDKEGHYTMMEGSVQDVTAVNTCAPNIGAPQYIRQTRTAVKETNKLKLQAPASLILVVALGVDAMVWGLLSFNGWLSFRLGCHVTACLCLLYRWADVLHSKCRQADTWQLRPARPLVPSGFLCSWADTISLFPDLVILEGQGKGRKTHNRIKH